MIFKREMLLLSCLDHYYVLLFKKITGFRWLSTPQTPHESLPTALLPPSPIPDVPPPPGKHMNDLLARYGAPVFVVNLVKKREKRSHESLLHGAFSRAVLYLNQFLPPPLRLRYVSFDMARANKL